MLNASILRSLGLKVLLSGFAVGCMAACDPGTEPTDTSGSGGSKLTAPTKNTGGRAPVIGSDYSDEATELGQGEMIETGTSSDRWQKADVKRGDVNYKLMANGWGPNFESQSISWNGTALTVDSMMGTEGSNYEPASYPTVFCGAYSDSKSLECGLPAAIESISSLRTGWSWRPNDNNGEFNAAYDIWLGTGLTMSTFSGYLMVWFRDPPGQQPAGSRKATKVSVANVPGLWSLWVGEVNNHPIINWARADGDDTWAMEFDVMDFVRDAEERGLTIPGSHILSVAVGFEIWNGPIENLQMLDFFVDVK